MKSLVFLLDSVVLFMLLLLLSLGRLCIATYVNNRQYQANREGEMKSLDPFATIDDIHNANMPAIAPKCWKTATRILLELTTSTLSSSASSSSSPEYLCQDMTEHQQKFLALEIAKCHLQDMGLELYQTPKNEDGSHRTDDYVREHCMDHISMITGSTRNGGKNDGVDDDNLMWDAALVLGCLKFLSAAGIDAYTHYVSHVQMLCARLTNEVVITQQQESHHRLRNQFREMSQQSLAQMDTLQRGMVGLTAKLEELTALPARVREEMSQDLFEAWDKNVQNMARNMEESLNTRMNEQLQSGTARLLESLSDQHHHHWDQLLTNILSREEEQEKRHREWTNEQAKLLNAQAKEIAEQRRALTHQREHIANMTALVAGATQQMKPLSSVEYLIRVAISGYGWITTFLYILCAINVTWLVTSLSITRVARPCLLTLVWIEGTIEILLKLYLGGSSLNDGHQRFVQDLRLCLAIVGIATFHLVIAWSLVQCVLTGWGRNTVTDRHSTHDSEVSQPIEATQTSGHPYRRDFDLRPGTLEDPSRWITPNWQDVRLRPDCSTRIIRHDVPRRLVDDHETTTNKLTVNRGKQFYRCVPIPRQQVLAHSRHATSLVSSSSPATPSRDHHNVQVDSRDGSTVPSQAPAKLPPIRSATSDDDMDKALFECQETRMDEIEMQHEGGSAREEPRNIFDQRIARKRTRPSSTDKEDGLQNLDKRHCFLRKNA